MNDGISHPIISWLWLGSGLAWGLRLNFKYGLVPKREHLRDPNGLLYGAFWNFFSSEKWTDEGVAFHKRLVAELFVFVAVWLGAYFVLAFLF